MRYLHFGSAWVQGAMRLSRPDALELAYTRELMLPLLLHGPEWPASVLQVGLGSASVTRFLHRFRPRARMTVVEIAPEVVLAARQYFRLPEESARLRIQLGDGHDFLAGAQRRFDLIVVDGFDARGRSGMLDSVPFYLNCKACLARRGVVAINLLTRTRGAAPALARIREAFGEHVLALPRCEEGNMVVLATAGPVANETMPGLREAAVRLRDDTGLNLLPTVNRLAAARHDEPVAL